MPVALFLLMSSATSTGMAPGHDADLGGADCGEVGSEPANGSASRCAGHLTWIQGTSRFQMPAKVAAHALHRGGLSLLSATTVATQLGAVVVLSVGQHDALWFDWPFRLMVVNVGWAVTVRIDSSLPLDPQ